MIKLEVTIIENNGGLLITGSTKETESAISEREFNFAGQVFDKIMEMHKALNPKCVQVKGAGARPVIDAVNNSQQTTKASSN